MKKFIIVVTPMAMATSLLTACSPNAAPIETTTAVTSEAASEEETAGKEVEKTELGAKTDGATSMQFQLSILLCGSISLYPILLPLAPSFIRKYVVWDAMDSSFLNPNISAYVAPDGSGVGISAAIGGTADFGILARGTKDSETEVLGECYQNFVMAKDALTVSISAENPIYGIMDDMSTETIRQISVGGIATWNQVGSTLPVEVINVYIRDLSGGVHEVFQRSAMDDNEMTAFAIQSASMTELATSITGDK